MCIVGKSLIYELMVEASVEEVVGSSNDMQVVIVGNVDHYDVAKVRPKLIHCVLYKKKRLKIDNKVWWELAAKVQSMVYDEKNEFNETLPMKMLTTVGIVWDFHIFGMSRIVCTCCKQGNSLMMCLKRRHVGLKSCLKLCMACKSIFLGGMFIPKPKKRTSLKLH
jgi:hypothetical protein